MMVEILYMEQVNYIDCIIANLYQRKEVMPNVNQEGVN